MLLAQSDELWSSGALYLVVLPRHAVVTTAMSCKKLPECQRQLPQAKQSTAHQIREIYGLASNNCVLIGNLSTLKGIK